MLPDPAQRNMKEKGKQNPYQEHEKYISQQKINEYVSQSQA